MNPIQPSRRELLAGAAALSLTPLRPFASPPGSFAFAFFSDTHVGLQTNIEANRAMLAEIKSWRPAFAINGGDVTDYGWTGEYDNYRRLIREFGIRTENVAGNHDVRWSPLGPKAYREGTGDPLFQTFEHEGCLFVLLDSTVPLSHYGHFESSMIRDVERRLHSLGREKPVLVFTHHWVGRDRLITDNEHKLFEALEPYNVKAIFNGHGHSDLLWSWNGIANTMNRGLYQESWQRVEVDRTRGEIRILRRRRENPTPTLVTTVPLAPDRTKRRVWAIGGPIPSGAEYRLGETQWLPLTGSLTELPLPPGAHRAAIRTDTQTYFTGPVLERSLPRRIRKVWETELPGGVMSHLKTHGDQVIASCMDGSIVALDGSSGATQWRARTNGYCHSSPWVSEDVVIVGSADGFVRCLSRRDGRERWKFETGGPVYSSPTVASGVVAVASGDGKVYGLDLRNGRRRWTYELPASNTSFIQSPAATDGERFYFGAWDRHIYALDSDGALAWRTGVLTDRSWAYSPAIGGPAIANEFVVVPANGNSLFALRRTNGEVAWETNSPGDKFGYSSPRYDAGRIYVGCLGDKGEVRCVDAANGSIRWTCATGATIYDGGPAIGTGVVAIGSVSGQLNLIDPADGGLMERVQLPTGHFLSTPAIRGNRIYCATFSDRAFCFEWDPR